MELKKILTVQDISCVGKCSLTAALPVLSAIGIEACVIPTAVLSTHTGGFKDYTYRDLTEDIVPITEHWKKYNITFDSIYTGYLGSIRQIQIMKNLFKDFGTASVFVDPVMGDNGKMYAGFTPEFAEEMKSLCETADVIAPNMTEAALLLGFDYDGGKYSEKRAKDVVRELAKTGAKKVILTGVSFNDSEQGAAFYDSETDVFGCCMGENINGRFHGTGDLFSSAAAGALVLGKPLDEACRIAVDFVLNSIKATLDCAKTHWYGVNFEPALPTLWQSLKK